MQKTARAGVGSLVGSAEHVVAISVMLAHDQRVTPFAHVWPHVLFELISPGFVVVPFLLYCASCRVCCLFVLPAWDEVIAPAIAVEEPGR